MASSPGFSAPPPIGALPFLDAGLGMTSFFDAPPDFSGAWSWAIAATANTAAANTTDKVSVRWFLMAESSREEAAAFTSQRHCWVGSDGHHLHTRKGA